MAALWQALAGVLVAAVLGCVLSKSGKETAILLSLGASAMVLITAVTYLKPLIELVQEVAELTSLEEGWIRIVLKTVGIGLVSQLAAHICTDSGNSAMAKTVEILTAAAVLWVSIPLMQAMLELVENMAGAL